MSENICYDINVNVWVKEFGKAKPCYDMNMEFGKNNFCYDINVNVWVKEFGKAKPCYDTNMDFGKNNFCNLS